MVRMKTITSPRGMIGFCVAVAVWLSDRWIWTFPALFGVTLGLVMTRRGQGESSDQMGLASELGSLLVLVSFVYLYLVFLIFQLRRVTELVTFQDAVDAPSPLLLLGMIVLTAVLLGLGAVLIFRMAIPGWLSRLWSRLLEER